LNPEKDQFKVKPPKTYKEQIEIFKNRNLQIENPEEAEKVLQRINYYRLSGYGLTLKDPIHENQYINGSSFKQMLSLYEFDRKLRSLLLQVLEVIEIAFRTHISYEIAHKLGPLGYKEKENFNDEKFHTELMDELNKMIKKSYRSELFIQHHFKKYGGQIPIWAVIEVTSFGFLSKFYKNLKADLKKHIAETYYKIPYIYIESWLYALSHVRNICAHFGRLYNKKLTLRPKLFKDVLKQIDNQYIFADIYVIERLLTKTEGLRFITDLGALIDEYEEYIQFQHIGFPENWKELLETANNIK